MNCLIRTKTAIAFRFDGFRKKCWFGSVKFYGISTLVGYLMPNPVYTYIILRYYVAIVLGVCVRRSDDLFVCFDAKPKQRA